MDPVQLEAELGPPPQRAPELWHGGPVPRGWLGLAGWALTQDVADLPGLHPWSAVALGITPRLADGDAEVTGLAQGAEVLRTFVAGAH